MEKSCFLLVISWRELGPISSNLHFPLVGSFILKVERSKMEGRNPFRQQPSARLVIRTILQITDLMTHRAEN